MLKVVNLVFLATEIPLMALYRPKHPADQSQLSNFSNGLRLCAYPLCILTGSGVSRMKNGNQEILYS